MLSTVPCAGLRRIFHRAVQFKVPLLFRCDLRRKRFLPYRFKYVVSRDDDGDTLVDRFLLIHRCRDYVTAFGIPVAVHHA